MDDDVQNWWLEFEEKKPDENIIDTFEDMVALSLYIYIIMAISLVILYAIA